MVSGNSMRSASQLLHRKNHLLGVRKYQPTRRRGVTMSELNVKTVNQLA